MWRFTNNRSSLVRPFIENINTISALYNQPTELLFDSDNIYLLAV